ncbi:MAG: glycosyltransferase family 2 protein [Ignavibacteriaceae bacterium]|jgi:GT2 family glycosyltransferase
MLYIIIPVYNRKDYTYSCLISLRQQTYQKFITIIIDDGSTDGTHELLEVEFPEVYVLQGDGNLWWAGSVNMGVKYALNQNAKIILTLNNDTMVENDFVEKMMYWHNIKPHALLGAVAYSIGTGKISYGGEIVRWQSDSYLSLLLSLPEEKRKGLHEVTHFPGRGLLIPSEVFSKIGFFDEVNFPQAIADYDFTLRAARYGFKIYCNYSAKLKMYSEESASVILRQNKNLKNYLTHLFAIKGSGNIKRFIIYAFKNCPKKFLIQFLIIGLSRRIFGYPIEWIMGSFNFDKNASR